MQISPWKQHLQKKRSISQRPQRKIQQNCNLRNLIFEILSQRFFDLKYPIFRFFRKYIKTQILTNLATKFGDLPMHLDQSLKMENNPQDMFFKLGFIHFFRRTINFGSILSYNWFSLWIGQENNLFSQKLWNRRFCFANISMNIAPPEKMEYTTTKPTKNATR